MEATAELRRPGALPAAIEMIDFQLVSTWLLGFGLIVYLGMRGGGFDPLVSDKAGVVIWWIVLAGLLVGAFPRRRLGVPAWAAAALLLGFLAWTALSLAWTDSSGNTSAEIARVSTYLGVFVLGMAIRGAHGVRQMVAAIGAAVAVLAVIALLSRLHPAWFPSADQTGEFLPGVRDRLSYPLGYWNGVAALTALGFPLLLNLATTGRSIALRALATAALPAMALTVYLTISRGGILAGVAALVVYLALAGDRAPRLATTAVAGVGGAILIAGADQRNALQANLQNAVAHHQGNEMLWMTIVVCLAVGLIQAAISLVLLNDLRPSWTVPGRRFTQIATGAAIVIVVIAGIGLHGPRRISHAVDEFKSGKLATGGASRLSSAAGEQRYPLWSSSLHEFSSEPLHGTGAGTFELWWNRNGHRESSVHDTHSLYLQTLAELGVIGFLLLAGFLVLALGAGAREVIRSNVGERPDHAAALAGVVAFLVSAAIDWVWQIPVLPIAMLLLAGALLTAWARPGDRRPAALPMVVRVVLAVVSLAAVVAIAIPLTSQASIRESQSQASAGELTAALASARDARNVEPDAGLPYLQEALVLEQAGNYPEALSAALLATHHEPANWKNWLILSRLQAESGQAKAAVASYRQAKTLNTVSPILNPDERVKAPTP